MPNGLRATFAEVALLWRKHRVSRVAAALSFYMVFSLAPLIFMLVVISRLLLGPKHALQAVESQLQPLIGTHGTRGIDVLVRASEHKVSATPLFIGGILVLVAVAAIFMQLQEALDDVWGIPEHRRGGWWQIIGLRLHAVVLIAALALFALFSLLTAQTLGWVAAAGVNIFTLLLFLTLTYRVLPRATVGWKSAALGALMTGCIILLGELAISFYFTHFHPESGYGSAGSFIVILIWMYYSAQLFLFGAVLTHVLERTAGSASPGR